MFGNAFSMLSSISEHEVGRRLIFQGFEIERLMGPWVFYQVYEVLTELA